MSNQIYIDRIQMKMDSREGFIAYDNYGDGFVFFEWSVKASDDDLVFLSQVVNEWKDTESEYGLGLLHYVKLKQSGISIDNKYYDFDEIEHLL